MSDGNNKKDPKQEAHDLAIDTVKQILLLSTGAIGLSLTFLEKLLDYHNLWLLVVGWAALVLSILFGILFHPEYVRQTTCGRRLQHL